MIFSKKIQKSLHSLLTPDLVVEKCPDISLNIFQKNGIRSILMDLDNTFISPKASLVPEKSKQWIQSLLDSNYDVYIITNNSNIERLNKIYKQLKIPILASAKKPLAFALEEFSLQYNIQFEDSAFIGNQLLTDVLVANWLGCYSILTDSFEDKLSLVKTVQQDFETFIRFQWLTKNYSRQ